MGAGAMAVRLERVGVTVVPAPALSTGFPATTLLVLLQHIPYHRPPTCPVLSHCASPTLVQIINLHEVLIFWRSWCPGGSRNKTSSKQQNSCSLLIMQMNRTCAYSAGSLLSHPRLLAQFAVSRVYCSVLFQTITSISLHKRRFIIIYG